MPYDLKNPPERIKALPKKAREIWIKAYNNAIEQYDGDEQKANATAWAAVKKAGYKKNEDGQWQKMADSFNCECIKCGHKMTSDQHCAELECPKCGGAMRRQERPGPGRLGDEEGFLDWADKEPDFDEVEIFKTGIYPQGEFKQAQLDEIVANFNPKYYEPPVTKDHMMDGPAHGWVEKIWRKGNRLFAKLKEVSAELWSDVKEGRYKTRSIELWPDFEEEAGKLVLRAVTFLGARPPQVKGMKPVFRAEDHHGCVWTFTDQEYFKSTEQEKSAQKARSAKYGIAVIEGGHVTKPTEWSQVPDGDWADPVNYAYPCPTKKQTQAALRYWGMPRNKERYSAKDQGTISGRLRKFAKKFEIESEMVKHQEEDMEMNEVKKLLDEQKTEFSERLEEYKKESNEKIKTLAEENAELKKNQDTKFSDEAKRQKAERIDRVIADLLKEGKITPAYVDAGFKAFLMAQPEEAKIEFGEGDEKKETSVIDFAIQLFQNQVKGAPVHFGELAPPDKSTVGRGPIGTAFKVVGDDEAITSESMDLHEKTLKFMDEYNSKHPQDQIDYKDALHQVGAQFKTKTK